jgi:hypothetical protein
VACVRGRSGVANNLWLRRSRIHRIATLLLALVKESVKSSTEVTLALVADPGVANQNAYYGNTKQYHAS